MMTFDQSNYEIRCEWGENGVATLAPISDVIIIVDVMSFSTAVVIATSRDAYVYPYNWKNNTKINFAESIEAELAGPRGSSKYSLSPASLMSIPQGTRLVLPSPNGSSLTLTTGETTTFAGCLRNAKAVARAASNRGKRISVIPCGEHWEKDNSLRPAIEDLVGAGAIIRHLPGSHSPKSKIAVAAFLSALPNLVDILKQCSSGRVLIDMDFENDIPLIAELDVDDCVPIYKNGAYKRAKQ